MGADVDESNPSQHEEAGEEGCDTKRQRRRVATQPNTRRTRAAQPNARREEEEFAPTR